MVENNENILTFSDYLDLSETSKVIQAVINDKIKYDTINILGTNNLFRINFVNSEKFKTFCRKLEVSVTTLIVGPNSVLSMMPTQLYEDSNVEKIILNYNMFDIKSTHVGFLDLSKLYKSLKVLTFICEIPLQATALNEIFGTLNYQYFRMGEVIFDCDSLPSENEHDCFIIEKIEMKFIKNENDDSTKIIVKPLKISDKEKACKKSCQLEHQAFRCESVTEISILNLGNCSTYFINVFKSFPFIKNVTAYVICEKNVWSLLKDELERLKTHNLLIYNVGSNLNKHKKMYRTEIGRALGPFPELQCRNVTIDIDDNCVNLIANHLMDFKKLLKKYCFRIWRDSKFTERLGDVSIICTNTNINNKRYLDKFSQIRHHLNKRLSKDIRRELKRLGRRLHKKKYVKKHC